MVCGRIVNIYYLAIYDLLFLRILIFGAIVVEGETMVGNVGGCKKTGVSGDVCASVMMAHSVFGGLESLF